MKCKHPPNRLYTWTARDCYGKSLQVVCLDCNAVLKGGETQEELEAALARDVQAGKVRFYAQGRPVKEQK